MIQSDLEEGLSRLPAEVAQALLQWRKAQLDRERLEARISLRLRAEHPDATATEIKSLLHSTQERYDAVLQEATFESIYTAKYESLMALKKQCDFRTAF